MWTLRECAFRAVLKALHDDAPAADTINAWASETCVSTRDRGFVKEVAYGTLRRLKTLEYMASKASKRTLRLDEKAKALLFTGLYQIVFMDGVPSYAAVDETVELAKRVASHGIAQLCNALLRAVVRDRPVLPQGDDVASLAIRLSYPDDFVADLLHSYGLETTKDLLEAMNIPGVTMLRLREGASLEAFQDVVSQAPPMVRLKEGDDISRWTQDSTVYIQNATPAKLLFHLATGVSVPTKILDLCAAPGGKSIAIHDIFPAARLFMNDVSEHKLMKIRENVEKYGVVATLSCHRGEKFPVPKDLFDVVIVDAPCSNSGTLNKRPEARWRLSRKHTQELQRQQIVLLGHARDLISRGGQLWYMTCSILPEENEDVVATACRDFALQRVGEPMLLLPNREGWDGGYAQAFAQKD